MKSIVVFNRLIPFKGYLAITLYPFIFVRKAAAGRYSTTVNNHEHIHGEQQSIHVPLQVFGIDEVTLSDDAGILLGKDSQKI